MFLTFFPAETRLCVKKNPTGVSINFFPTFFVAFQGGEGKKLLFVGNFPLGGPHGFVFTPPSGFGKCGSCSGSYPLPFNKWGAAGALKRH